MSTYEEAITILRALVAGGQTELANDLANALVNKANALAGLRRLPEALSAYEEAITIRRALVAGGQTELANDLAKALVNNGVALENHRRIPEALACYSEAIAIWKHIVELGQHLIADNLIKAWRIRFGLCRQLSDWKQAANDLRDAMTLFAQRQEAGDPLEPLTEQLRYLLHSVRELSLEEQSEVFAELGDFAEVVRHLLVEES